MDIQLKTMGEGNHGCYLHVTDIPKYMVEDSNLEITRLIPNMQPPPKTGASTDQGDSLRKGNALFMGNIYSTNEAEQQMSACRKMMDNIMHHASQYSWPAHTPLNIVSEICGHSILISTYRNGEYYKPHRDTSFLTMLIWVSDDDEYEGGEIVFNSFNETVKCTKGTGVIFPSYYMHEVNEISCADDITVRKTMTAFLVSGGHAGIPVVPGAKPPIKDMTSTKY